MALPAGPVRHRVSRPRTGRRRSQPRQRRSARGTCPRRRSGRPTPGRARDRSTAASPRRLRVRRRTATRGVAAPAFPSPARSARRAAGPRSAEPGRRARRGHRHLARHQVHDRRRTRAIVDLAAAEHARPNWSRSSAELHRPPPREPQGGGRRDRVLVGDAGDPWRRCRGGGRRRRRAGVPAAAGGRVECRLGHAERLEDRRRRTPCAAVRGTRSRRSAGRT